MSGAASEPGLTDLDDLAGSYYAIDLVDLVDSDYVIDLDDLADSDYAIVWLIW